MSSAKRLRPSLRVFLLAFVLVTGAVASLALIVASDRRLADFERAALEEIGARRAAAVAQLYARSLWSDWRDLQTIASGAGGDASADRRAVLDLIVGAGERVSWAGIADLDGTVIVASGGLLEGGSVAQRPWFQRGLEGPFAGDVHDAKLLAGLLPSSEGEPLRFLDLAAPIRNAAGEPIAVIGFHLSHAWASAFLEETARIVGVEAVVADREGRIVIGPAALIGQTMPLSSFGAARAGADATFVETWPDGRQSLSIVVPAIAYRNLPSFGWTLVARIDADALAEARSGFSLAFASMLLVIAAGLIGTTVLFARIFLGPLRALAFDAERIVAGEDICPTESQRTSELARLSRAVVLLQARSGGR